MRARPTNATDKPKKRSIVATLRRKAFLDYLYFTDRETLDPLAYSDPDDQAWAGLNCDAAAPGPAVGGCTEINFITQDAVNGPLHSNDSILVCGSPNFGNDADDRIELNQDEPGLGLLRQRRHPGLHRHAQLPRRHPADAAVERRARGRGRRRLRVLRRDDDRRSTAAR